MTDTGSERKVFITFEIWIFFLRKQFATVGLYSCPEPCEAHFIIDAHTLFDDLWTVDQKHPPSAMIKLGIAGTI